MAYSDTKGASPIYAPLPVPTPSQSIRVLDLDAIPKLSGSQDDDAQLVGNLRVVSLQDSPRFAALSYTWGTYSLPKDTIECGGHNLDITTNCRDALRAIRRQFGSVTVWLFVSTRTI